MPHVRNGDIMWATVRLISAAAIALLCAATARQASAAPPSGAYALDDQIDFNVLDQVEYYPQTRKLVLMGHYDERYDTPTIPYLQYLATLLDHPNPEFTLNWTPDSERRVEDLFRRLDSGAEQEKLERDWRTWLDDTSQHVTPAGRVFLEMFGVTPPDNGPGNSWETMDQFQMLAGIFKVTNRGQAATILRIFDRIYRAQPNATKDDFADLFAAAGVLAVFNRESAAAQAGTTSAAEAQRTTYRAFFQSADRVFNFANNATTRAFDNSVAQGAAPSAAMQAGFSAFQQQLALLGETAAEELWTSKPQIQVPLAVLSPSLGDSLVVQPEYFGMSGDSLLAKLMFAVDYTAKALVDTPELADTIPGYRTERAFRHEHPNSSGSDASSGRLWVSVDKIDAARSPDGNVLAFKNVAMRINFRRLGPDGKDVPNQQPGDYEQMLTSHYENFAQSFSPLFHEFREAAKLSYVAQWLKSRDSGFQLPVDGRASWQSPPTVPGIIFVNWFHGPSQHSVMALYAIGGASLRVPPPASVVTDPAVKPASDLIAIEPGNPIETTVPGAAQGPRTIKAAQTGTKRRKDCKPYNPVTAASYVRERTEELRLALERGTTWKVTLAVAVATDDRGCEYRLISGSEGDYMRPIVRALAPPRPNENVIDGFDHAERNIVGSVMHSHLHLEGRPIGATKYICCVCKAAIDTVHAIPVTPVKPDCL